MKILSKLETKLKTLPSSPGVYFHKDKTGQIIYIGKAAVLKNRVRQYFQNSRNMDLRSCPQPHLPTQNHTISAKISSPLVDVTTVTSPYVEPILSRNGAILVGKRDCGQDLKTRALVAEIADIDWMQTESEIDALFLEAQMVKRYMPRYNILLRDDKSLIFVRIDMASDWPYVSFTRNPVDDNAEYFGPYYNGFAVKKALRYLRRTFPYYTKAPISNLRTCSQSRLPAQNHTIPAKISSPLVDVTTVTSPRVEPILSRNGAILPVERDREQVLRNVRLDLDAHLGLSPVGMTSGEYRANLRKLISYINGNRKSLTTDLERDMKAAASRHDFETAAIVRNKLQNLRELQHKIVFGDKEFLDISKDQALQDLTELLGLSKIPIRIEGYDISHTGGTNVVASMVVFKNGVSDRAEYRKFKTRIEHNNDFYNMNETMTRRLSEKNLSSWGKPDLVLIDGGKGQLDAALQARDKCGQSDIPFIGLAKQNEQIVVKNYSLLAGPADESAPDSREQARAESGAAPLVATRGYVGTVPNKLKLAQLGGSQEITDDFILINLPKSTHIIKLLQRIRDESHRFAISYHTVLKRAKQTTSSLDDIPGIGPKTRSKLIRKFGSIRGLKQASELEIAEIIGLAKAKLVFLYIQEL